MVLTAMMLGCRFKHRIVQHCNSLPTFQSRLKCSRNFAQYLSGTNSPDPSKKFSVRKSSNLRRRQQDAEHLVRSIPKSFLRKIDIENTFDPHTNQRIDVKFNTQDGRPIIQNGSMKHEIKNISFDEGDGETITVTWKEENESYNKQPLISKYSYSILKEQIHLWKNKNYNGISLQEKEQVVERIPWTNWTEEDVPRLDFSDVVLKYDSCDGNKTEDAIKALYQYGILLIQNTPTHSNDIAALASALSANSIKNDTSLLSHYKRNDKNNIGTDDKKEEENLVLLANGTDGPMRTLYGNVWSTTFETGSTADSAYGCTALPLHTDMSYLTDPPGLQIFTMVTPAPNQMGASIFADGLALAETLRIQHPKAFDTLCSNIYRRYRSLDTANGWNLEATGPVIHAINLSKNNNNNERIDPFSNWGPILSIRHNDLDRMPDLPPYNPNKKNGIEDEEVDKFYENLKYAHDCWDQLLAMDKFRLVMKLESGDTVIVANQRCLHGRQSFEFDQKTRRNIMGCYVSQDDLNSRFRQAGYHVF